MDMQRRVADLTVEELKEIIRIAVLKALEEHRSEITQPSSDVPSDGTDEDADSEVTP